VIVVVAWLPMQLTEEAPEEVKALQLHELIFRRHHLLMESSKTHSS
jgi:hypothetical protein